MQTKKLVFPVPNHISSISKFPLRVLLLGIIVLSLRDDPAKARLFSLLQHARARKKVVAKPEIICFIFRNSIDSEIASHHHKRTVDGS